jgi:DNA-3-methyladenine glycosylase II
MTIKIKRYLVAQYPEISDVLTQSATISKIRPRDMKLPEAFVRVIAGQMLSTKAAQTIYQRIKDKAVDHGLPGSWLLDDRSLRSCGLSTSKAQAVCAFGKSIGDNANGLDHWYKLDPDDLMNEIKSYKGMGDWSAAILALFYIGHEDIFPQGDGSLQRAVAIIESQHLDRHSRPFKVDKAAPYRSYLALYLWHALDNKILNKVD